MNLLKLNRRTVLQGATAGAALGTFGIALAPSAHSSPQRGGHLKVGTGFGSTTDTLDPYRGSSSFIATTNLTRLAYLTEISPGGELVGDLAESWESGADTSVWHFKLKRGVEFHNGKSLGADDVIASINAHRGEDSKSRMKIFAEQIDEIVKEDDHSFTLRLKLPNTDYPTLLTSSGFGILPATDGQIDPGNAIGAGAYMIEAFDPGVSIRFKRHPNYHREDRAFFDSAEMFALIDSAARQNALRTGEVDVIDRVEISTAHLLARNSDIEVLDVASRLHYTFPMITEFPPFDNNDVRLALKYAIDREELLDKVLRGHGLLGNDHPIPVSDPFHASDIPQRSYDPDKAKFHLGQAGLDGLDLQITSSEGIWNGAIDAIQLYGQHAQAAGINISINRVPNDGYWSKVWRKIPWSAAYWGGRATADQMFSVAYSEASSRNDTRWKDARFNELLVMARGETDHAKRKEMYAEMQLRIRDEGATLIPLFANFVIGVRSNIAHHDTVAGNWDLDGGKIFERWWKAA